MDNPVTPGAPTPPPQGNNQPGGHNPQPNPQWGGFQPPPQHGGGTPQGGQPLPPNFFPQQGHPIPPAGVPPGGGFVGQNQFPQQYPQQYPQHQGAIPQQPMNHGMPMSAQQPPMHPMGGMTPPPAGPPVPAPPPDPNARLGQLKTRGQHIFIIPPHPNTTFDEEYFLALLEGSISLTMEEKQRVIDAIPQLRIEQINELISIFEEEKQKFSELENEFSDDVQRLKHEREKEIEIVGTQKEEASANEDAQKEAEALRRSLLE